MAELDTQSGSDSELRSRLMPAVRTVVVKVGTNVVTRPNGELSMSTIHAIIEDIADLMRSGVRVILVSSGAVSMGRNQLDKDSRNAFLSDKQAYAAVGQIWLMGVYQQALSHFDIRAGQVLLTEDDFKNRGRYLNLRNTMSRLLEFGALPIVNENDTISTSEIEESGPGQEGRRAVFGDNDVLSALVASKLGADLLLLLSDVDGLYEKGPPRAGDVETKPLSVIGEITPEVEAMASGINGASESGRGRGGMATKLRAIRVATQSGAAAVITNGNRPGAIRDVIAGKEIGTLFVSRHRLGSRKRWIAFANAVTGQVAVNRGAQEALVKGNCSLLFAGVTRVSGDFRRGDVVSIVDESGREFARGISNYTDSEASPLLGKQSREVTQIVGHNYEELIHRDNLVILK